MRTSAHEAAGTAARGSLISRSSTALSRPRIVGVDIARTIALVGMIVSHLLEPQGLAWDVTFGFPSSLFAVLAGVSLGLSGRRGVAEGGLTLAVSRHSLAVRGAILIALNIAISPFSGEIVVVLTAFGSCYLALSTIPRWTNRSLWALLIWLVAGSAALHALDSVVGLPYEILREPYPLTAWAAYMTAGVIACRLLLYSRKAQLATVAVGLPLAVLGVHLRHSFDLAKAIDEGEVNRIVLLALIDPTAHTGGLIDILATSAGALAIVGLCLLLRPSSWLFPFQAAGAMSLTIYVAHVLTAGAIHTPGTRHTAAATITILAALVVPALIRLRFSQGPLEWAVRRTTRTITNTELPPRKLKVKT